MTCTLSSPRSPAMPAPRGFLGNQNLCLSLFPYIADKPFGECYCAAVIDPTDRVLSIERDPHSH